MAQRNADGCPCVRVPKPRPAVQRTGGSYTPGRMELCGPNFIIVTEEEKLLTTLSRPDSDSVVFAGSQDSLALRAELRDPHVIVVLQWRHCHAAIGHIPDAHGFVPRSRNHPHAIRTET